MPKKKNVEKANEEIQKIQAVTEEIPVPQAEPEPPVDVEQSSCADSAIASEVEDTPEILSIEHLPDAEQDIVGDGDDPQIPPEVADSGLLSVQFTEMTPAEELPANDGTLTMATPPIKEFEAEQRDEPSPVEKGGSEKNAEGSDALSRKKPMNAAERQRRQFYATDFWGTDRGLSPEQRQEWSAIYASYRGQSVIRGKVVGVDPMRMRARERDTGKYMELTTYGVIISSCCARIIIPEKEMWFSGDERPDYALRNLYGATVDFVVTQVDREESFVVASRRKAMAARRRYFTRSPLSQPGTRTECDLLIVGPSRCTVSCYGYDIELSQKELSYPAIADLREAFRDKGTPLPCIVKGFDGETGRLLISVKEARPNPFDGAEFRHPLGSRRQGKIGGKYGGGVFVTLPDDVTVMCNYAFQYEDSDFEQGDQVLVIINRYAYEKKEIYGKIIAKF